jgi:transcriptional regulator with XRE-family HTH domain
MSADEERFAENLRAMREAFKITQSRLAEVMTERGFRWHQATVYKIESGERQIQLGEAGEIARIFDVSLTDMLKAPAEASIERKLDWDISRFEHAFDEIGWRVLQLEEARKALTDAVAGAQPLAEASEDIAVKIGKALRLLGFPADDAFDAGKAAVRDHRVQSRKSTYTDLYGVRDYKLPSTAELIGDDADT